jgi:hypothetical protein
MLQPAEMRTLVAIAVSPLAVIPVLLVLFGPWAIARWDLRSLIGVLVPAVIIAYPLVVLFGLPMHFALVRQRATAFRHYVLVGALLGAVPVIGYCIVAIVFEAKFDVARLATAMLRNAEWGAIGVVVFGSCSAAVAIAFRTIAVAR